MVALGLALRRPDLTRSLVLSNTAARTSIASMWRDRILAVRARGLASIIDSVVEQWFAPEFRVMADLAYWREMMAETPVEGYIGSCSALGEADFTAVLPALRLPVLAIAGAEDRTCPPAHVRETALLIAGARFHQIEGTGHLPCVEKPEEYAAILTDFLKEIDHG